MNRIRIHVLPSSRNRVTQTPRPQEPQACSFTQRPCSQPRLEGLEFCIKHVLEDKNAPYKQCSYVSAKNGKRCPNASPKVERKDGVTFCAEHARRNAMALRAQMRKSSAGPSPETLLSQLSGYHKAETAGVEGGRSETSRGPDDDSLSEEEQVPLVLDQTWRGDPDSDADSIDSDHEDPLKHAGIYTAEEVALITREKLIRLQSLYIDQFKRLQHLLKEKKRRYLHNRKVEHETLGSSLLTGPEGLSMKESQAVRAHLSTLLSKRNYEITAVDCGEAAIEAVKNHPFDCVLMDVLMPGIDGYKTCREILRITSSNRDHTPVIMLTSKTSPFDKIRGKMSGCSAYLTKPIAVDKLILAIEKHV